MWRPDPLRQTPVTLLQTPILCEFDDIDAGFAISIARLRLPRVLRTRHDVVDDLVHGVRLRLFSCLRRVAAIVASTVAFVATAGLWLAILSLA